MGLVGPIPFRYFYVKYCLVFRFVPTKELHGGIGPMFEAIQQEGLGNMLQAPGYKVMEAPGPGPDLAQQF